MDRANYSVEQRVAISQCLLKKDSWLEFCANGPWEVTETNKKEQFEISQCVSADHALPCLKSTGIFDFSVMQMFACLHNSKYRPQYDSNIESASMISKVAANTYMIYQKTKSMLVVSSRDLVLMHHVAKVQHPTLCPNGGILIMAFTPTPEQDQLHPESKGAVRAFCHVSTSFFFALI